MSRIWIANSIIFLALHPCHADEGRVPREGFDLYYRTSGSGTPAIILSGGPGLDVDYMEPAAEFIPSSYMRVLLEQRGTGRSRPPKLSRENMTLPLMVEDLEALRIHLKQDQLLLVGHSWGGMLAMAYAAKYPNRVGRMLLIGPAGLTSDFAQVAGDNIMVRLHPRDLEARAKAAAITGDADKVVLEGLRAIAPAYFFDRAKALAFTSQLKEGSMHADMGEYIRADIGKTYDLRAALGKFNRPVLSFNRSVLIVQGHQDPVPESAAEETHRVLRRSKLVYMHKCGHFPWLDQPDEFRRIVSEFLAKAN